MENYTDYICYFLIKKITLSKYLLVFKNIIFIIPINGLNRQ